MILPYTLLGLAAVFFISRWLNALQLGEDTASGKNTFCAVNISSPVGSLRCKRGRYAGLCGAGNSTYGEIGNRFRF